VCTLRDPISFTIIINYIEINSWKIISMVNYTEYIILCKYENGYDINSFI